MQTKPFIYMLEIAEQQSLSGAARRLGISQSALSQYLAALEKELGLSLFFSYQKKMFPTPAGVVYLDAAQKIVEIRNHTYQKIRVCTEQTKTGRLVAGVSGYTSSQMMARLIPRMFRQYPELEIVMREEPSERLKLCCEKGETDLAIVGYAEEEKRPDRFFQFSQEELYVAVPTVYQFSRPPSFAGKEPGLIRMEELRNIPFVMPGRQAAHGACVRRLFERAGYEPTVVYQTDNPAASVQLVQSGFGACFLAVHLTELLDQTKCDVFALQEHPKIDYGVIVRADEEPGEALRYFVRCILEQEESEKKPQLLFNETSRRLLEERREGDGYQIN